MLRATVGATIGAWPPAVKGTAGSVTNAALQLNQGPLGRPEKKMPQARRTASPMWRPTTLGDVIAERSFVLTKNGRKRGTVTVRFGKPVKGPKTNKRDPWWCPLEVRGLNLDGLHPVAGIDALQTIILALNFVTRVIPERAAREGLRVEWLGDTERIALARHSLAARTDDVLSTLFMALRDTAAALASTDEAELAVTRSLSALMIKAHGMEPTKKRTKSR